MNLKFSDFFNSLINPIPYQFWFLQVLMSCFIVSPVFFFFIKKLPKITILILLIFYLNDINSFKSEIYGFGFFYLGGYLSYYKIKINKKLIATLISIYLLTIISGFILFISQENEYIFYRVLLHKISILSGLLLLIYYVFKESNNDRFFENSILSMDSGFFFFLYAFHEPTLSFLKKIWIQLFSSTYNLIAYFFIPMVLLIVTKWFYLLLKKKIPKILNFYTGYR
jgi:peptidoglycan/LPS O-acetylase OafA/YrhL